MLKTISLLIISIALLGSSGTFVYQVILMNNNSNLRNSALKSCSNKIPSSATSVQKTYRVTDDPLPGSTGLYRSEEVVNSYSQYPAFDRCMADKGFVSNIF